MIKIICCIVLLIMVIIQIISFIISDRAYKELVKFNKVKNADLDNNKKGK